MNEQERSELSIGSLINMVTYVIILIEKTKIFSP